MIVVFDDGGMVIVYWLVFMGKVVLVVDGLLLL